MREAACGAECPCDSDNSLPYQKSSHYAVLWKFNEQCKFLSFANFGVIVKCNWTLMLQFFFFNLYISQSNILGTKKLIGYAHFLKINLFFAPFLNLRFFFSSYETGPSEMQKNFDQLY